MNLAALGLFVVLTLVFLMGVVLPAISGRPRRAILARQTLDELGETPSIEVVVPAYLEVSEIEEKVRSLRAASEHCPGGMHITINAGDPETAAAARAADADRVIVGANRGKPAAINEAVGSSTSDIIVLTDATAVSSPWHGDSSVESLAKSGLVSSNKLEGPETRDCIRLWRAASRRVAGRGSQHCESSASSSASAVLTSKPCPRRPWSTTCGWRLTLLPGTGLGPSTLEFTTEKPGSRREQWERRLRICEGLLTETLPQVMQLARGELGRHLLLHKVYRMTLGCVAFWAAALAFSFVYVPYTAAIVLVVLPWSVAWYAGRAWAPAPLASIMAPLGMQAVPVVTAVRVLTRRVRERLGHRDGRRSSVSAALLLTKNAFESPRDGGTLRVAAVSHATGESTGSGSPIRGCGRRIARSRETTGPYSAPCSRQRARDVRLRSDWKPFGGAVVLSQSCSGDTRSPSRPWRFSLIIEYSQLMGYRSLMQRPVVLDMHNIESELMSNYATSSKSRWKALLAGYEACG